MTMAVGSKCFALTVKTSVEDWKSGRLEVKLTNILTKSFSLSVFQSSSLSVFRPGPGF